MVNTRHLHLKNQTVSVDYGNIAVNCFGVVIQLCLLIIVRIYFRSSDNKYRHISLLIERIMCST
jgi:hypothetical protein